MLGPCEADAFGAELARELALAGSVGVHPYPEAALFVGPRKQLDELLLLAKLGLDRGQLAGEHLTGGAVDRDLVALAHELAVDAHLALDEVDVEGRDASYAG